MSQQLQTFPANGNQAWWTSDLDFRLILEWKAAHRRLMWEEIIRYSTTMKVGLIEGWRSCHQKRLVKQRRNENKNAVSDSEKRVPRVLWQLYDGPSGGSLGVKKTLTKIQDRLYEGTARKMSENGADGTKFVQPEMAYLEKGKPLCDIMTLAVYLKESSSARLGPIPPK